MMEQHWFMDLIRMFFAFLDSIVYGLISSSYNLIENISHYKVFGDDTLDLVTGRIYAVLSIFMLFKVSFSFITYIVNPDSFTDREKGVQNIIKNIVIMFVMLVMCPWAFKQLWGLQDAILTDNTLANFVFGSSDTQIKNTYTWAGCDDDSESTAATNGDYIALMVLQGFYRPYDFSDVTIPQTDWDNAVGNTICTSIEDATPSLYLDSSIYNADIDADGFSFLWIGDTDVYIINYRMFISTAVGVVVLLILVGFAMDVGLRVVKLSFLELMAPIPIVSYIDPASGKNGMFKKWIKEVGSTWAGVFIRLLALFFAVRVIQEVGHLKPISSEYGEADIWVQIFVIIGALMFAKQLPKLIQDITGINLNGGFNINPIKKFQDQALGGKTITKLAGAGLGMGASAIGSGISHGVARYNQRVKLNKEHDKLNQLNDERRQNRLLNQANRNELNSLKTQRDNLEQNFSNAQTDDELYRAYNNWERMNQKIEAKQAEIKNVEAKDGEIADKIYAQAEKYQKAKGEYEDSRLQKNTVAGYAGEIFHGAVQGAKNGYKSPGHIIHGTAEAIKDSSELRNYREKYSIKNQMGDRVTDVFGIKNESGTTSIVKKELKTQTDTLNEVNRSIELLNRTISQMASEMGAEFQKAIQYAPNGRMEINASYSGPAASRLPELEEIFSSYYGRIDEKVRIEKAIKDLQDTADSVKPGSSGKPKK